jgi:hypothetical protein
MNKDKRTYIFCRLRPVLNRTLPVLVRVENDKVVMPSRGETYSFDGVFAPSNTSEQVFSALETLMDGEAEGNRVVFFYGNTGAGKTTTFCGSKGKVGILTLFLDKYKSAVQDVEIREVYNNKITTLLSRTTSLTGVNDALLKRNTASTNTNATSSRSHLICTFTKQQDGKSYVFVDLAGAERLKQTGDNQNRVQEAIHVNRSLTALRDVIESMSQHRAHIPYRNSPLTMCLYKYMKECTDKMTIILCCAPEDGGSSEVLRFGRTATRINRTKKVAVEELLPDIPDEEEDNSVSKKELENLQHELSSCQEELAKAKKALGEKRQISCGLCGGKGHNKRTCTATVVHEYQPDIFSPQNSIDK